ncbi:MAG: hypothetical protein ACI90V_004767 [Bacillariaceae sp.]|jgi:hypothetical protein
MHLKLQILHYPLFALHGLSIERLPPQKPLNVPELSAKIYLKFTKESQ